VKRKGNPHVLTRWFLWPWPGRRDRLTTDDEGRKTVWERGFLGRRFIGGGGKGFGEGVGVWCKKRASWGGRGRKGRGVCLGKRKKIWRGGTMSVKKKCRNRKNAKGFGKEEMQETSSDLGEGSVNSRQGVRSQEDQYLRR